MTDLYILLIHGTWAGSGRWTHHDSQFRKDLKRKLKKLGYSAEFQPFPWNGSSRWRARSEVATAVNDHLSKKRDGELLIIAHSHGGNIATKAVRERLTTNSELPIRGVVCLNTPFLTHEIRASSGYLLVWLLIASLLWICLRGTAIATEGFVLSGTLVAASFTISGPGLLNALLVLAFAILLLLALSKVLLFFERRRERDVKLHWAPRPNVLCLSCPDDEAITFLGLGEGIANLPQLLLHPLAVVFATVSTLFFLHSNGHLTWCAADSSCWNQQLGLLAFFFAAWMAIALIGGLCGAAVVTVIFGLSLPQAFKTLVSRVLVSYTPLRPAQSFFRIINAIHLKKGNPLQLFHSAIYRSPKTTDVICEWLHETRAPPPPDRPRP